MSKIPEWQKWDLKYVFASYIYPRLILYKNEVDKRQIASIPNWVLDDIQKSEETVDYNALCEEWSKILGDIIFAFKSFIDSPENLSNDEIVEKQEYGLILFAKYYKHLWD